MCEFRSQDSQHSPWKGLPPMAPWHHVGATMEITLDKNGSLYDPAGTESWNMQIRYETMRLTMHPTKLSNGRHGGSRVEPLPIPENWQARMADQAMYHQGNQSVFVGGRLWTLLPPPALGLKRKRTEGRKREKFYIYLDVTHTQSEERVARAISKWGPRHKTSYAFTTRHEH